jgi:hypothetical protein
MEPTRPSTEVVMDEDIAWRLFTKGIAREQALSRAALKGNEPLASRVSDAVAIIA